MGFHSLPVEAGVILHTFIPLPLGPAFLFQVEAPHKIFYRVYNDNNTNTKATALFLHGGPGAGCFPNHARFFDPEHYKVVLFDQRGCGKSEPKGEARGNDIWSLVNDIEALRLECKFSAFHIFLLQMKMVEVVF